MLLNNKRYIGRQIFIYTTYVRTNVQVHYSKKLIMTVNSMKGKKRQNKW